MFSIAASRRAPFEAKLVRLQGAPFVMVEDTIRNSYFLHIVNKQPVAKEFVVEAVDADGLRINMPVRTATLDSMADIRLTLFVEVDRAEWRPGEEVTLEVRTTDGELQQTATAPILGPR